MEMVFTSSSFIGAIPAPDGAMLEAIEDCEAKLTVGWV